jgi:hypothetical protein
MICSKCGLRMYGIGPSGDYWVHEANGTSVCPGSGDAPAAAPAPAPRHGEQATEHIFLIESKHSPHMIYSAAICNSREDAEEIVERMDEKEFGPHANWHVVKYTAHPGRNPAVRWVAAPEKEK